jgi:hypothetical protein
MRFIVLLLGTIVATDAAAQASDYTRVFIPLRLVELPGAFGTRWSTDLAIWNQSDRPAAVFSQLCIWTCQCGPQAGCVPRIEVLPGRQYPEELVSGNDEAGFVPGLFIHVESAVADRVAFNLRLFEESQRDTEFGIEVPVVRERDFLTLETWLVNIPVGDSSRAHLRIYGLESPSGTAVVRVRIYPDDADGPSYDETVVIPVADFELTIPKPGDFNAIVPGYLAMLLTDEMTADADVVRIAIEPVTAELRFWAMASVTSNTTQNVTLVTPQ